MIRLVPKVQFERITAAGLDEHVTLALIADMCRINTLNAVKNAGSGHLGSSFSAMEIVVWLYFSRMNTLGAGIASPDRDVYFSSKGHDVPGLYAVLHAAGVLSTEQLLRLRRLGGLDGHPDVGIPGIEANSGSLGMGISKGRGIAWAKRHLKRGGHVYVMTGDGELQEGQNYEALQTTVQQKVDGLSVIIDHNKLQTDRPITEITDLLDIEAKLNSFGWHVARCNGHEFAELSAAFSAFDAVRGRPRILIADTIKGRGVSFMEHPAALRAGSGLYRWHAGAPDDESFDAAHRELVERTNQRLEQFGLSALELEEHGDTVSSGTAVVREYVADAYGAALVAIAEERTDIVVLDGDLAADCRVREFENRYPDRFIENGIAEQDMVSMAGGLARSGLLPVVNTFASFLGSRPNEQIYNNATERSKIIYACHYAGLIPAGPGKSHQSIRDISLFGALPGVTILQPCNSQETKQAVEYCVVRAEGTCVLRLVIGPSPRPIDLPTDYELKPGQGVALTDGNDALMFAYGPVMLHEALSASEHLANRGFGLRVVNMPWLNRVDVAWLTEVISGFSEWYVLEDHSPVGGLGQHLLSALAPLAVANQRVFIWGVEGFPACGTPAEALAAHRLDGASLARRLLGEGREQEVLAGAVAAGEYTSEAPQ